MDKETEDCYYFLYSVCKRGPACAYRHNPLSKQNPVLCEEWRRTKMCRDDCPFRHSYYHLEKKRSEDYCYWEDKPEGCTKEFCEFKHRDPAKDSWKEGGVKSLDQIRREKNARKRMDMTEEAVVDPVSFEKERREKRKEKAMRMGGYLNAERRDDAGLCNGNAYDGSYNGGAHGNNVFSGANPHANAYAEQSGSPYTNPYTNPNPHANAYAEQGVNSHGWYNSAEKPFSRSQHGDTNETPIETHGWHSNFKLERPVPDEANNASWYNRVEEERQSRDEVQIEKVNAASWYSRPDAAPPAYDEARMEGDGPSTEAAPQSPGLYAVDKGAQAMEQGVDGAAAEPMGKKGRKAQIRSGRADPSEEKDSEIDANAGAACEPVKRRGRNAQVKKADVKDLKTKVDDEKRKDRANISEEKDSETTANGGKGHEPVKRRGRKASVKDSAETVDGEAAYEPVKRRGRMASAKDPEITANSEIAHEPVQNKGKKAQPKKGKASVPKAKDQKIGSEDEKALDDELEDIDNLLDGLD